MNSVKHAIAERFTDLPLEDLLETQVARFSELDADWDAFADSRNEGTRRAQFRFIGAGGSGKIDPKAIVPGGFTFSIMQVPPGQGGSAHTHEIEEAFFVLKGTLTVFFERDGKRVSTEDVYMQTIIGSGRPGPVGYVDDGIYEEEQKRLASRR
jgi:mannose-6-phosphate isomerase-like protein (cupin superfamily)